MSHIPSPAPSFYALILQFDLDTTITSHSERSFRTPRFDKIRQNGDLKNGRRGQRSALPPANPRS